MKIGLYFGSFNPVHIGHLLIAQYVVNNCDVQQVWLVVSPQNPLKASASLLNENHRLQLVRLAIDDNPKLKASNIEFKLPRPSFTIDTLTFLKEKYPGYTFSIIVGSDSYLNLNKWKNPELLIRDYKFIVYNRPGFEVKTQRKDFTIILDAPLLDLSSTKIRRTIKEGKSIKYMVPDEVRVEIENQNFYK